MSKAKDAQAVKAVFDYLNRENRPFSAVDIHSNLHKEYGKTAVVKALEGLAEQGKIMEKTYGKQKVYLADQSQFAAVNDAELKQMDSQINKCSEDLQKVEQSSKSLTAELSGLNNAISTEDAKKQMSSVTKENEKLKERLNALQSNENAVSPAQRKEILKNREKYVREWRKRKRIANDILNAILEGYPKTKQQLFEEVGIETDEEYKVQPPQL